MKTLKNGCKETHPSREEMIALNKRRKKGDELARLEMFERNQYLVFPHVNGHRKQTDADYDDLVQVARQGLLKAIDKFDHKSRAIFSTHAYWWIEQAIRLYLRDNLGPIRLPAVFQTQRNILLRVREMIAKELGREPSAKEIAEECEISEKQVRRLLLISTTVSLDKSLNEVTSDDWHDVTPDSSTPQPDAAVSAMEASQSALKDIRDLSEHLTRSFSLRDRQAFLARFGLFSGQEPKTFQEVGDIFGVSRERIRQICARIFRRRKKLQRPIGNDKEMQTAIDCLVTGLEVRFAHTGKLCPEIMEVIGGPNGQSNGTTPA